MVSMFGELLAGLGLFFVGLQILTENLKRLSSRRLRTLVARYTRHPMLGVLWGGAFIVVTQSAAATMFIIVSMMRSGMMSVRQSMPLIVGLNVFAGVIVVVLVIDVRLGVLFLLGVTGVLYNADSRNTLGSVVGAVFGVALLFFGLDLMKTSVAPMADAPWFSGLLNWTSGSYMLGFLIGCALSFVVQSSIAVTAVVLAFQISGVFGFGESVMIIYGANAGSSLLTLVLSVKLRGQAKQIAMYQTFYNIGGAALLVPLFYIELWTGVPMVMALILGITGDPGGQIAVTYMLFNLVPAVLMLPVLGLSVRLLQRLWPDTEVEIASRPKFLHEHAADDPDTAMDLVALEQARMVGYLSEMFAAVRDDKAGPSVEQIREAFGILGTTVRETIDDLASGRRLTEASYDRLNALLSFQHSLDAADSAVAGIARDHQALQDSEVGRRFVAAVVEGVDGIVLLLSDLLRAHDRQDRVTLESITSEEGNGIKGVRAAYLAEERGLDAAERLRLLAVANHAERLIWLLGEMGRSSAALSTD
jgi:phosphate:Na+ symporter